MKQSADQDFQALRARGACGYADLLLSFAAGGPEEMATLATLLGFEHTAKRFSPEPAAARSREPSPLVDEVGAPEIAAVALAETPFWRLERRIYLQSMRLLPEPTVPPASWIGLSPRRPSITGLAEWNTIVQRMRLDCTQHVEGNAPDVEAAIRRLERGRLLDAVPRRRRRRWGERLQIVIDRSQRLTPFFEDQDRTAYHLARLFPNAAVEFAISMDGFDTPFMVRRDGTIADYRLPDAGSLVVVLGDLGCLASHPDTALACWGALGRRLTRTGCRAVALTPCPRSRWLSGRLRHWTMVAWSPRSSSSPMSQAELAARAERLLRLLSPAIRIEPGLLRDVRRLLGDAADAGTEADVWQRPELKGRSSVAATLEPDAANKLRVEFAETEPAELRLKVIEQLRKWRGGNLAEEIWFEELLSLDPETRALLPEPVRVGDVAAARQRLLDLSPRLASLKGGAAWYRRLYERASADYHASEDVRLKAAQQHMYLVAHEGMSNPPPPPANFEPGLIDPGETRERLVEVRQVGDRLVAQEIGAGPSLGSLLGTVATANGLISIVEPDVEDRNGFWALDQPSGWADDWGRDAYGVWAVFSIVGRDGVRASQRLRWCPPGRFKMSSPESEEGRFDDEGPRHHVTIATGFWMFDTACSEQLWQAVMGKAGPVHKGPAFPVTTVSWKDVRLFLRRLNAAKPGLALNLPSEAQGEYACRAGTDTPYSFGMAISRDQACYESDGPVPVGSLPANPWGLHEMHGNVWEWCADHWHGSYEGAPADGSPWIDADGGAASRVLRGGSWLNDARYVRAACRDVGGPTSRNINVGFRCARVQSDGATSAVERGPGRSKPRERSEPAATTRPERKAINPSRQRKRK